MLRRDMGRIVGFFGDPVAGVHREHMFTCEELSGFASIRSAVMTEAWRRIKQAEAEGLVLTDARLGATVETVWIEAKQAARACPGNEDLAEVI